MADEHILVIGAGAAGLTVARRLSEQGKRVTVLEAKSSPGGRILDVRDPLLSGPVMLGAEFIHGILPHTLSLLKEAGLKYYPVSGASLSAQTGELEPTEEYGADWELFMSKLNDQREDMSLTVFLSKYFGGEKYAGLRATANSFAQGYDAADPDKVSVLSLKSEWQMDTDEQFKIEGGYGALIKFLETQCLNNGCTILYEKVVSHFNWSEGFVEAITKGGERYAAQMAVITLPLGVMQVKDGGLGFVSFTPPLPIRMGAVRSMGFGSVIKVVLVFKTQFWKQILKDDALFIFSEEVVPTWWTSAPQDFPVLTGWLAGPAVEELNDCSKEELIRLATRSLANIFSRPISDIEEQLVKGFAYNWSCNPFSRGAYTYTTVEEPDAQATLASPVEGVLFFSGEATYSGPFKGTVEAALVSGEEAARRLLDYRR